MIRGILSSYIDPSCASCEQWESQDYVETWQDYCHRTTPYLAVTDRQPMDEGYNASYFGACILLLFRLEFFYAEVPFPTGRSCSERPDTSTFSTNTANCRNQETGVDTYFLSSHSLQFLFHGIASLFFLMCSSFGQRKQVSSQQSQRGPTGCERIVWTTSAVPVSESSIKLLCLFNYQNQNYCEKSYIFITFFVFVLYMF